ncbi:hypothetical protein P7J26_09230 [Streptococcus suis]|uniref:PRTase-CE domain-containing protein n=2 Tax=Streptococcus suis TaxID=1307 RepID=A0A4T2HBV6_STRSU|nr:hypothetical protein [Streptococcus suis]TII08797.1 hypothetical protein FAJ34_01900 [Streptococcus suis]
MIKKLLKFLSFLFRELNKKERSLCYEDEIRKKYLKITTKTDSSEISDWIEIAIKKQGEFFTQNSGLYESYSAMLDEYNYYSKLRIQNFLKAKVASKENFIFTYLKKEEEREESSGIITPLLYEIRENSKAETYTGLTNQLFHWIIIFKEEIEAYYSLLVENGGRSSVELEDIFQDIKKRAKSHQINKIDTLDEIIIFEDFVGTGNSLIDKFLNTGTTLTQLKKLKELKVRIIFCFLEISQVAQNKLIDFLKCNELENTIIYEVPEDTLWFKSYEGEYAQVLKCLELKESKYSLHALVSTYLETPNNTISLFWRGNDKNWAPLFPRTNNNLLSNNEDTEYLKRTLEKYDFRKSKGLDFKDNRIKHVSPKVNLMILILLSGFEGREKRQWDDIVSDIPKIISIPKDSCYEIVDALKRAGYIQYVGDYSEIKLTKFGRSTIAGVKSIPKIDDFIDESVLI